jgi:dihydropteroate synthase
MQLRLAHRTLDLDGPPLAMAIVNVTPDSFYDGGATPTPELAVARALEMLTAGAAIIDVGGMTAQPGVVLGEDAETARDLPTVAGIRAAAPDAVISVDTYRAGVAAAVLDAGADLVNDHTGLSDPALAPAVAERDAGLVITHLGLTPKQVQGGRYEIAPEEIGGALLDRAAVAEAAGVRRDAILLDPGLGFGKWPRTPASASCACTTCRSWSGSPAWPGWPAHAPRPKNRFQNDQLLRLVRGGGGCASRHRSF